jgi:hypothetical protein
MAVAAESAGAASRALTVSVALAEPPVAFVAVKLKA